jgi:hypothetical protein
MRRIELRLVATVGTIATFAVLALALTGCAPAPAPAQLPAGVLADVYQPRTEIQSGRLAIQVINGSDAAVTVTSAEFVSPDYSAPIVWEAHDVPLGPGRAVDLRVVPVEPACGDRDDPAPGVVVLGFRLEDGREGVAEVEAGDPFDAFPRITDERCLGILLAEIAMIEPDRVEPDGRVVFSVTPTGDGGSAELIALRSTILVTLLGSDGLPVTELALGRTVTGTDPAGELAFPIAPARCDPHAIAEDKVGTLFPIEVEIGSRRGVTRLSAGDEFRAQLYAFVTESCS